MYNIYIPNVNINDLLMVERVVIIGHYKMFQVIFNQALYY